MISISSSASSATQAGDRCSPVRATQQVAAPGSATSHAGIVSVLDGHPATLGWLGSVCGHRLRALGVEHFGQCGSVDDLYASYGLDAQAIVNAAQSLNTQRPVRYRLVAER